METIYFTNNADSGDGSLRNAWSSAEDGDIIMPDPTAFASSDTIEILLASAWSGRGLALTLDGGDKRVVLNGQGAQRFMTGNNAAIAHNYRNVDFKNFYRSDTSASPAYYSALGSLTFTNCRFYGNVGPSNSSFIRTTNSVNATLTFSHCVAYNNGSSGSARIIAAPGSTVTLNGCTMDALAPTVETLVNNDSLLSSEIDFSEAGFVDASTYDYRLTPSSPYLTGGTLTGTDFLGHARSGSKGAYDGSWFVVSANGTATISSNTTIDYAEIGNGATVTFSGSDRILAATKGATVGTATFGASTGSSGYFAVPAGTDASGATFSGAKLAYYGAGISNFAATTIDISSATLTWNQANVLVPVLLEKSASGTWTTVTDVASSPYSVIDSPIGGKTFRIFDGTTFLTVTTETPVFELSTQYQVISGTVASLTEDENKWETFIQIVGVEDMNEDVKRGQAVTVLARIYDAFNNNSPLLNDGTNIVSVHYTCEKRTKGIFQYDYTPIEGHENVDAGTDCVLDSLVEDDGWDEDNIGYNFKLTPDITEYDLFEETGEYRFKVVIELSSGNPIVFYRTIQVTS